MALHFRVSSCYAVATSSLKSLNSTIFLRDTHAPLGNFRISWRVREQCCQMYGFVIQLAT